VGPCGFGAEDMEINKGHSRRGFLFSVIVFLIFISLVLLLITWSRRELVKEEKVVMKMRAESMREFVKASERDIKRMVYISGCRALFYTNNYVVFNRTYLSNASAGIIEMMTNSTINGISNYTYQEEAVVFSEQMQNASMVYWKGKVEEMGDVFDFNVSVNFLEFSITPHDAWNLNASVLVNFYVFDKTGLGLGFNRTFNISTLLPIEFLEDPMFPMETNGMVYRRIEKGKFPVYSVLKEGSSGDGWAYGRIGIFKDCTALQDSTSKQFIAVTDCVTATTNCNSTLNGYMGVICKDNIVACLSGFDPFCDLKLPFAQGIADAEAIANGTYVLINGRKVFNITEFRDASYFGYYFPSNSSPDVLSRMEGKSNASAFGIESLAGTWATIDKTAVDCIYFSSDNPASYKIKGMFGCETMSKCNKTIDEYGSPIWHFMLDDGAVLYYSTCAGVPDSLNCTRINYYDLNDFKYSP